MYGYSISRKDNNLGYCPENRTWASLKEQANNKRNNVLLQVNGVKYTITQLAERFHLNAKKIYAQLYRTKSKENPNQMELFG